MSHGLKMEPLKYFFSVYDVRTCSPQKATNMQKKCLYLNICMAQTLKINPVPPPQPPLPFLHRNKSKAMLDCLSYSIPHPTFLVFHYGLKHWRRKFHISWSRALREWSRREVKKGVGSPSECRSSSVACESEEKSEAGAQVHYGVLSPVCSRIFPIYWQHKAIPYCL